MKKKEEKKEEKKLSHYEQLIAVDVITPVLEAWSQGRISCDMDTGKFKLHREIGINRPWTFATVCQDRKCGKWLGIYHKFYKVLPPPCLQCWKVVYAPSNLNELLDMQVFQAKLGLPAKCGTEQRDYTSGLGGYRAFWYAPFYDGLKGGRKHFKHIKEALIKYFGMDLINTRKKEGRFFLKRGCTELERDHGPSDAWESIDHSAKFNLLESIWEDPANLKKEWPPLVMTNKRRWIESAVAYNDLAALDHVVSSSLGVGSVKYEESDHHSKDFSLYLKPLNGATEKEIDGEEGTEKGLFRFEPTESKED